ncbi:MAG: DUF5946 family protein [Candidatus Woesebacteria bacterium]
MSICSECGANDCQDSCYELSAYTLSLHDDFFIHQVVVDAYAASHNESFHKPIRTAFALMGQYLLLERNYSGKEVQQAHMKLAKQTKDWPRFVTPSGRILFSVADVLLVPDEQKAEKIMEWAQSVWQFWKPEHENIQKLVQTYLEV